MTLANNAALPEIRVVDLYAPLSPPARKRGKQGQNDAIPLPASLVPQPHQPSSLAPNRMPCWTNCTAGMNSNTGLCSVDCRPGPGLAVVPRPLLPSHLLSSDSAHCIRAGTHAQGRESRHAKMCAAYVGYPFVAYTQYHVSTQPRADGRRNSAG
ncbi:hypothetical protein LZ31DRAFT_198652 [Colletotrichum somersetense]|nr:hypothetical protein LZ31DRAFT_198652 [Colletotrichum somersetense]